jgi:hypothetical protein
MPVAASCRLDGKLRPSIDTVGLYKVQVKKKIKMCKRWEYYLKVSVVREMVSIIMRSSESEGESSEGCCETQLTMHNIIEVSKGQREK